MSDYRWKLEIKDYNPEQARIPAGQSGGGRWTSKNVNLDEQDKNFLLAATDDAERAIAFMPDGKTIQITGGAGEVSIPDGAIGDIHTHRTTSKKDEKGFPILSASDYRTASEQAMKFGSYHVTALLPSTRKTSTLQVTYDRMNPVHKTFSRYIDLSTQDLGGMVSYPKYMNQKAIDEGIKLGIFKHSRREL